MAKKNELDITKTGPVGYKALQNQNNSQFDEIDKFISESQSRILSAASQSDPYRDMQQMVQSPLANSSTPWGESIFDNKTANQADFENLGDVRAENQPWYAQAAAGITKGGILAGTTFVDGTLGLVDGIYTAMSEGRWSGIWDNPVTQAMAEINEVAEEELPNYYTQLQQENPWSADAFFSANTLFDKFVKNLGFMVGAAYSGGLYSKALSYGAKGIGAIKGLASAAETLGASNKTQAVFKGLSQSLAGGKEGEVATQLMAKGAQAMDNSNATRAVKSLVGSFFNAQAEGTIEAVANSNDWVKAQQQRIDDLYQKELVKAQFEYQFDRDDEKLNATIDRLNKDRDAVYAQIEKDRIKMGNADLLFNLPILWAGDIATFGKLYAGGWRAARNEAQTVTKATKQALADAKAAVKAGDEGALERLNEIVRRAEKTGYRGLSAEEKALVEEVQTSGSKLGAYSKAFLKGPVKEGNEEMSQAAAAEAAGLYYQDDVDNIYNAQVHPEAKAKVLSWMNSIGQGIANTYGDPNKWEEGLIGAITGMLGSPTIGRKTNSTNQTWLGRGKIVGMSGGLFTEIRDQLKDLEGAERTAAHITKTLKDPNFQNRFRHLVAQTYFNDMMEKAVVEDSELDFKNAETAAAFEDIMYFKKGNRLGLLKAALANTELFEQADIDQIVEMTQKQYSVLNDNINEDRKKAGALQNQLVALKEDYETRFGEEAHNKAEQAYFDGISSNDQSATQRYNEFIDARNEAAANIDNLEAQISNYYDRINNYKNVIQSPFIKIAGDETTTMSADEIKEDIQKRANKINQIIDDISEAQDEIDNTTGGVYTDEQLTTLTWYKVRMKDWERRASAMSGNIREFIRTALENPTFAKSVDDIEHLLSYADELKLSAEQRALFGGNIRATKAFLRAGQNIRDILEQISSMTDQQIEENTGSSRYGIVLAKYLASDKEIELEKEDGSKIKMPLGKYLQDTIGSFVDADLTYNNDQKAPIKKILEDLTKIGEAYSKYDKLLEEYRKNPEKIDQVHAKIDAVNENHITNKAAKTIAERFDWNAPTGKIVDFIDDNIHDIENMGGMDKFMKSLDNEKKKKLREALKLRDGVISINDTIDEADMDENMKNIAKDLVSRESKEVETIVELASALNDALNEGIIQEMADDLLGDDVDERVKDDLITKSEEQLAEFFNTTLKNIASSLDKKEKQQEADRKRQEEIEEEIKKQKERGELPVEKNTREENLAPPEERDLTPPVDKDNLDTPKDSSAQNDFEPPVDTNNDIAIQNTRTRKEKWKPNDNQRQSDHIQQGTKGYGNRPQISEYYLSSVDGISPVDYYTKHSNEIPAGVDKDAFMKYITAVHRFLKDKGAYNYVSHYLKPDDEIIFELNTELSKEAGVPIVVMKVGDQVVGTIKSQLDFDAYDEAVKKNPNRKDSTVEAQRALYNAIVNQDVSTVKTKVKSLMGGALPIISRESKVSEIFGNNTPIIGWVDSKTGQITTGNTNRDNNVIQPENRLGGQIYVLIPSNNGSLIPALCYSTPISTLADNDWYIEQASDALIKCGESIADWSTNVNALQKWLSVGDIHINFQYYDKTTKKSVDTDDLSKATRISINYLDANGKRQYYTIRLENGVISKKDAIAAIKNISKDNGLTTNINKNRLTDTDYINRMSRYLYTNLMVGEQGQYAMNDWFTYEQTDIEKEETAKNETRSAASPKNTPRRPSDPAPNVKTVTVNGTEYTMTADGVVMLNNEVITDSEIIDEVKKALNNSTSKIDVSNLNDSDSSDTSGATDNVSFAAFTVGSPETGSSANVLNGVNIRGNKSRRRGGAGKPMLATDERHQESMTTEVQLNQAIEHCKQLFPALANDGRIIVVKGMINAIDENGNPIEAFGLFKDGILYLSDKSPIGTAYHEAFHYVTDFLLSDFEKKNMFKTAKNQWGNLSEIELEEKLAEAFRAFMNGQERIDITQPNKTLSSRIRSFFRMLKNIFDGIFGREQYLDTLFYNIYRGRITNRTEKNIASKEKFMEVSEMESIKQKAIANGIFMKAPNGNPTNLTERQWLQVRTKAFKEWFGDWENNPANASKVVDENGEPLVVYHATNRDFTTFKMDSPGRIFKNIREPFGHVGSFESANKIRGKKLVIFASLKNPLLIPDFVHQTVSTMLKELYKQGIITEKESKKINISNQELRDLLYAKGYDSIIYKNKAEIGGISYGFINPNQIKSAIGNIGTFDANNPDIRFMRADTFKQNLLVHRANKFAYSNLSQEEKEYLALRKISKEDYEALNTDQKEILLHCM